MSHQLEQVFGAKVRSRFNNNELLEAFNNRTEKVKPCDIKQQDKTCLHVIHTSEDVCHLQKVFVVLWEIALVPVSHEERLDIPSMVRTDKTNLSQTWNPSTCLVEQQTG